MSLKTRQISKDNYRTTIVWLEENLTEMGATKKEILKGELLLEESFFRMVINMMMLQKRSLYLSIMIKEKMYRIL